MSQTELRLVVDEEPPRSATPESLANVVFLCAEDDDVELLGIVQKARDKHVDVDVAPGVDRDAEALIAGLPRRGVDAFVLFCSPRFPPADALGFRRQFEARFPSSQLIVVELDKSRADGLVDLMIRRLALARAQLVEPSAATGAEVAAPRVVVATPIEAPTPDAPSSPTGGKRGWVVAIVLVGLAAAAVFALLPRATPTANVEPAPKVAAVDVEESKGGAPAQVAPVAAPSAETPSNRARLQRLLGAEHPALADLDDVAVDAAAMVIRAIDSDDPCGAVAAGTAALREVNPGLLALVLERAPQPTCAAPAAETAPDTETDRVAAAAAKDRGRRRGRGKAGASDAAPRTEDAPASTPAAASSPAPRQAKLVDDELLTPRID